MFSVKSTEGQRKHKKNTFDSFSYQNIDQKKTAAINNIDEIVDNILARTKVNSYTKRANVRTVFRIGQRLSTKKLIAITTSFVLLFAVIASASSLVDPDLDGTSTDIEGTNDENAVFSNDTVPDTNETIPQEDVDSETTTENETDIFDGLDLSLQCDKEVYFLNETVSIQGRLLCNETINELSINLLIEAPGFNWSEVFNVTDNSFLYEFVPDITGNYSVWLNILFENFSINGSLFFDVIDRSWNDSDDEVPEPPPDDEEPPPVIEPDIPGLPFDTYETPENSLGASIVKIVNTTYFWDYFARYSSWYLDAWDPDSSNWVNVTQYLNVISNRSEDNQFEKISLEFTAPMTADYRLTYIIDRPVKKFIYLSDQNKYQLTFPAGYNGEYTTYFNFSDIAILPNVILNHGVENINGIDTFWFSVQRNNIQQGTAVFLDPTFGNTATSGNNHDGDEMPGGRYTMGAVGGTATSITAYFSTAGGDNSGRAAIYDSGGNLLTNGETGENTSVGDGWVQFDFGTSPTLTANADYYLVVFTDSDKSDLQYAASGGNGLFVDTGETYPNFPATYAATLAVANANPSIYCTYSVFDISPPIPDPMAWDTDPYNVSSSSITMVATTASDDTPPISYYFNETTGNSGGTDSGWQAGTSYTDNGLSENTQYGYEVRARDSNSTPNVGNYSTPIFYVYTSVDPPTDGELTFAIGTTWINATVAQPPNPTSGSTGSNFSWTTGGSVISDWQNGVYYHNRTELTENTNYGCQVQYRNGDGYASSFNPTEKTNYTLCEPPANGEFTIDTNGKTWINMSVAHPTNPATGSTAAYFECVTGGVSDSGWVTDSAGGRYYYNVTGLNSDTTYGFRVKYRNAEGEETTYTSEKQQTTDAPDPPTVITNESTGVEETNATMHGYLQSNGSADTICYFLLNNTNDFGTPIFNLSKGIISDDAEFENDTAGETTLTKGTRYYYIAQANNSAGWSNGAVQSFLTKPDPISGFTATTFGTTQINLTWTDGTGGDGAYIEYAENSPPSPWNEGDGTPVDADGNVTTPFYHTSLTPGARYYYKAWAYATDGGWTSSGNQSAPRGDNPQTADVTLGGPPSVQTNESTGVEETNATLIGFLQSNGTTDTTCYFLWGVQNPPIDNNVTQGIIANGAEFSYDTSGTGSLSEGTLYYFDTQASNSVGWDESGGVKTFLTKPNPPSNLVAQMNSSSIIYLTWSTGAAYNTTYIERNASGQTVWARGEGTELYNGTGTNYEDTDLLEGVTYYYRAWSFANWTYDSTTLHQWSDTNASDNNKTNSIPTISNEDPTNESTGVSVPKQLGITVNDADGDSMIITWYSNSSGPWLSFGTNVTGADGNGTYHQTNSNFSNYSKTFYWNVSVSDGSETNDSETFCFSTESLVTSVNTISPYIVTTSPKTITATGDSALDKVTLYYRWSEDNSSWDSWNVLTYDDFESGFGNYTDGGDDCALYTGGTYAHQPSNAAEIRDNTGDPSSFYHTSGIDVDTPNYKCIKVDFWFQTQGFSGTYDFLVEYFDGTTWQQVANYVYNEDFQNGVFYNKIVWINESTYNFPTNMQIKFRCDAWTNNELVYIDEVYVNATTQSAGGNGVNWTAWSNVNNPDTEYSWSWDFDFPNSTGYYEFYSIGNRSGSPNETAPASADARCRFNRIPTITNEVPANESKNIQLLPQLNITVNDVDGELMTITWYSNSSGPWVTFGTNVSVYNGTYYQNNSNFSDPGKTYWWNVSVTDGVHTNESGIFHFITSYQPSLSNPGPSNNSIGQKPMPICNVTVSDQDGGTVTVRFYENTTGPWILQQTNSSVDVTTPANVVWDNYSNASEDFTTYWWKVSVSDGKGNYIEEIYNFRAANTSIEITPGNWDQGLLAMGSSNETTGFYFNLTNEGDAPLYIQIKASNATNATTGAVWRLNATPDFDNFTLQYNKSDGGTWTTINLTYDTFVNSLGVGTWQTFDLKLFAAPKATYGHPLTVTVTFRSVAS